MGRGKTWSDEELRYLRDHRKDGSVAIGSELGRSATAVKVMASRLGISLMPVGFERGELCPMCGKREVERGTVAGRSGICRVCHIEEQTYQARKRADEIRASREYDAARQDLARARRGR